MSKKKTQIQIKHEKKARSEAVCRAILAQAKRNEKRQDVVHAKRKSAEQLAPFLALSVLDSRRLRDAEAFTTRTYNQSRQIIELIDHLFVKYPVPGFLYRLVLSPEGREMVLGQNRSVAHRQEKRAIRLWEHELFFAIANGRPITGILKGVLTKKECHFFLLAPVENQAVDNLYWAKMTASGMSGNVRDHLMNRIVKTPMVERFGARMDDLVRFFAVEGTGITRSELMEVTDFLIQMTANPAFTLRGRTLKSVLKMSREWHQQNEWGVLGRYTSWAQSYPAWETREMGIWVRATELTNNRLLHEESHRQKHCVFTYLSYCEQDISRIVSFRWLEQRVAHVVESARITVEIRPDRGEVVQIRGTSNRRAYDEEMTVIKRWASQNNLQVSRWANGS